LVLGDNASGKSILRRLISLTCRDIEYECIQISMEGRFQEMGGIRGFIYGAEDWESTGYNSAHTIIAAINTSKSRSKPHVIIWDEPDLGLSDDWAVSAGIEIRNFIKNPPKHLVGCYVTSHSRYLVKSLSEGLDPTYICLGEGVPESLGHWINRPLLNIPKPLSELKIIGHTQFLKIKEVLDNAKNKNN
jgi:hypothetical protein